MPPWLSEKVIAALIAAFVAAVGVVASVLAARREADLRTRELATEIERLAAEQESVRQPQLTEILKKRIETYPALWEIIAVYGRNCEIQGKPWNHEWARMFLQALIDNNAKNGAFLSDSVYGWYSVLRTSLESLSIGPRLPRLRRRFIVERCRQLHRNSECLAILR